MRKHLFLGRGRCVQKKHIQSSLHGKGVRIQHGLLMRPIEEAIISGSGAKKKLSPLKFKF